MNEARTLRREAKARELRAAKQGRAEHAIGELTPGCEIYILTMGQFSLIHALMAILKQTGPAIVDISTWTAANAHLEESAKLLESRSIKALRFLVDRSFLTLKPAYCANMRALFGDGCIRTCRTHAKFMTVRNRDWSLAVRTSMNLNENPRLENLEISDDPAFCKFLVRVVDDVFEQHVAGDYNGQIPDLETLENVVIPGQIKCGRPSVGQMVTEHRKATIGREDG